MEKSKTWKKALQGKALRVNVKETKTTYLLNGKKEWLQRLIPVLKDLVVTDINIFSV